MSRLAGLWRENRGTILVLAVAYFALRSTPTEIGSTQEFLSSLANGQPIVLLFYSNT